MLSSMYRLLNSTVSRGGEHGRVHIFIFHRVLEKEDPLQPGEPGLSRFETIIKFISEVYNVISIDDAVNCLKSGRLPKRAACITFDDGYLDNYTNAFPVLKKYSIPATIFIATDYIGRGIMWNDILIESVRGFNDKFSLPDIGIDLIDCNIPGNKKRLLNKLLPTIKYKEPGERQSLVNRIQTMTSYKPVGLMMDENEIKTLHQSNITIGAHTKSHPILAELSREESHREISGSKEQLENIINCNVDYFAYPNGNPGVDYSNKDIEIVKSLGFKAAMSTSKRITSYNDKLFELPRFTPWDLNMHKFILRSLYYAL